MARRAVRGATPNSRRESASWLKEADESAEWLDLIAEAELVISANLQPLRQESRELLAIFSASVGTARRNERLR
jgi:hypothetical protein